MTNKTTKRESAPLIVETHPKDYNGFPFITLVQYRRAPVLVIVDNADDEQLQAFVLDLCRPEDIDEEMIFQIAINWHEHDKANYPISIAFAREGLTAYTSKIYRTLNMEFISRIIGPVPKYPMKTVKSIKRRRRKNIPSNIQIQEVKLNLE
ncbi:MAG: hypothetical protein ACXW2E_00345 [Nitrososphaeraceae archaeon]